MDDGEWVFYEDGKLIHSKLGIGKNNPVWIKYDRDKVRKERQNKRIRSNNEETEEENNDADKPTWEQIKHFLTKALKAGAIQTN